MSSIDSLTPSTAATIVFLPSGRRGKFSTGITLLEAARQLGEPVESICGGHVACGKCQVQIETGKFPKLGIQSGPEHVSPLTDEERAEAEQLEQGLHTSLSARRRVGDLAVLRVNDQRRAAATHHFGAGFEKGLGQLTGGLSLSSVFNEVQDALETGSPARLGLLLGENEVRNVVTAVGRFQYIPYQAGPNRHLTTIIELDYCLVDTQAYFPELDEPRPSTAATAIHGLLPPTAS
jgi:ferredoxin